MKPFNYNLESSFKTVRVSHTDKSENISNVRTALIVLNSSHVYAYNRAVPLLHAMTLCHFLWHHIFIYPLHHVPTLWFKIIVKPAENELWQWSQRVETWIIVCIIVHNQPCMSPIQNLLTFMVINWYSWASIRIQATDAVMASIAHCLAVCA